MRGYNRGFAGVNCPLSRGLAWMIEQLPIVDSDPAQTAAAARPGRSKGTYCFVSLGCPKNLVDSERMLGLLQLDGYELVSEPEGADFVVVNTCGFIEAARHGVVRRDRRDARAQAAAADCGA